MIVARKGRIRSKTGHDHETAQFEGASWPWVYPGSVNDLAVPAVVRAKAQAGAAGWLDVLPDLIDSLERGWRIRVGRPYPDPTEAFVAEATLADGTQAVLKLMIPREGDDARNEITVLRLADGRGCARLLRADVTRGALLTERLGPSLHQLGLPIGQRLEILCAAAGQVWRPAPDSGLPTGAAKGRWLAGFITATWTELGRPCSERAVDHALACAARRVAAHDDERAVLVHGDVHEWNALQAPGGGFKLVDPDGLHAEAEYDLGVLMREDPVELLRGDPRDRARWLARRCGKDAEAIWEWGVVERVSTGLLATRIGLQPVGRQMLAAADHVAR
jgi:streptomycin 6-kinase